MEAGVPVSTAQGDCLNSDRHQRGHGSALAIFTNGEFFRQCTCLSDGYMEKEKAGPNKRTGLFFNHELSVLRTVSLAYLLLPVVEGQDCWQHCL